MSKKKAEFHLMQALDRMNEASAHVGLAAHIGMGKQGRAVQINTAIQDIGSALVSLGAAFAENTK